MSRSPTYGNMPRYPTYDTTKNLAPVATPPSLLATPAPANGFFSTRSLARVGWILGIGGLSVVSYYGIKYLLYGGQDAIEANESEVNERPKVILHQCPRGFTVPCISPFPLKLETLLRVTQIPYEVDMSDYSDVEGRVPWLTVGGDLAFQMHECVQLLTKAFGINLDQDARPSRLTASRLVEVMLENRLYWGISTWRWIFDKGESIPAIQPYPKGDEDSSTIAKISESVRRAAVHSRIGRQPLDEVTREIAKDLRDLSAALGKHYYFLGDTNPGEVDCTAFAMLAQILWAMPNCPFYQEMQKYPNLCDFVLRMRDEFWKDWNDVMAKPEEQTAAFVYPVSEFALPESDIHSSRTGAESEPEWEEPDAEESRNFSSSSTPTSRQSRSATKQSSQTSQQVKFDESTSRPSSRSRSNSRSKASVSRVSILENNNDQSAVSLDGRSHLEKLKQILDSLKRLDEKEGNESEGEMEEVMPPARTYISTQAQTTLQNRPRPATNFQNLREEVEAMAQALQSQITLEQSSNSQQQGQRYPAPAGTSYPTMTPGGQGQYPQSAASVEAKGQPSPSGSNAAGQGHFRPFQGLQQQQPVYPMYQYSQPQYFHPAAASRSRPLYQGPFYANPNVAGVSQLPMSSLSMSRPDLNGQVMVGGPMSYQHGQPTFPPGPMTAQQGYFNDMGTAGQPQQQQFVPQQQFLPQQQFAPRK